MLGGQQFVQNPDTHSVVSDIPMVPAIKSNSSQVDVTYGATLLRQGGQQFRTAHVRMYQTNAAVVDFTGRPEDVLRLADAIEAYPKTLEATPKTAKVNGRDLEVANTVNDSFLSLGVNLSADEKGFRLVSTGGMMGGMGGGGGLTGRQLPISFHKEDAANLVISLRDAAVIAQQIP